MIKASRPYELNNRHICYLIWEYEPYIVSSEYFICYACDQNRGSYILMAWLAYLTVWL